MSHPADSTRRYRSFLATYSRALLVLVALVNVSLLLAALRDWQVYRLSGIGAALPLLPGWGLPNPVSGGGGDGRDGPR